MYPLTGPTQTVTPLWWNVASTRHSSGCNFSFLDGHAEYYKWHGAVLPAHQTDASPNAIGQNGDIPDTSTVDLPRAEAGGAQ